jgi:hypothetical protein
MSGFGKRFRPRVERALSVLDHWRHRQTYAQVEKTGRVNEIPTNHSPEFAPVISPTLRVGIDAMLAAAGAWLTRAGAQP